MALVIVKVTVEYPLETDDTPEKIESDLKEVITRPEVAGAFEQVFSAWQGGVVRQVEARAIN